MKRVRACSVRVHQEKALSQQPLCPPAEADSPRVELIVKHAVYTPAEDCSTKAKRIMRCGVPGCDSLRIFGNFVLSFDTRNRSVAFPYLSSLHTFSHLTTPAG